MLSIGKLAAGQQRYYDQQVAQGHDDYYSGRGEAPGEWIGSGAQALGLSGRVMAAQFNALLEGNDPRDPSIQLRSRRASKVAALDLTFSAPKSVSVLFAVGDESLSQALVESHEAAVGATLTWLEDTAVEVRRGAGGLQSVPAGGLIAAAYRHRMSRSLDPQLHTHVVAANLAEGPDGRYTALNGTPLYRSAKTAGYLYQAHLRAEVTERLGLRWGAVAKGAAELEAVPTEVLEEFSRRRHEMEKAAAAGGFSLGSKRSSESAALGTRERKQYGIETHSWQEEVLARAAEHGLTWGAIDAIAHADRTRDQEALVETGLHELLARRLVGEHGLTERANTFDDRVVLQALAQAATAGARVPTVRAQSREFAGLPDVLETTNQGMTTVDLVACEERLIAAAFERLNSQVAVIDPSRVERSLRCLTRPLSVEQRTVVESIAGSGNGVDVVEALAGTGKTYTAGALRQMFVDAGYEVLGVAPTGRAARELSEEAGLSARTIDRALIDIEQRGISLPAQTVVILDEAGMAPTRLTARLLAHARDAGAKVVAIGDSGQLPSVLAGGWLKAVGSRTGEFRLTEVHRQRNVEERRALSALHNGAPGRFVSWAFSAGRIRLIRDETLQDRTLECWIDAARGCSPGEAVMITRDNETRASLNAAARRHLQEAGELRGERSYDQIELAPGDRIICRSNDRRLGVENGTRATVNSVGTDRIAIEIDGGAQLALPADYVSAHVEHAYCLTGHGMQGSTVERAIIAAVPDHLTRGWSYSALSRARDETILLVADDRRREQGRAETSPTSPVEARPANAVLALVAKRMLIRDDEDLAVDQLSRDPRTPVAASISETEVPPTWLPLARDGESGAQVRELFELARRIEQTQLAISKLPTRDLARLDELVMRAEHVENRLTDHRRQLERLPSPGRFGLRRHDSVEESRSLLTAALAMDQQELAQIGGERELLTQALGDPAQLRAVRQGLEGDLTALNREQDQLRSGLADDVIEREPVWLRDALGSAPSAGQSRRVWDRAAREVVLFRLHHGIDDDGSPLGPPLDRSDPQSREWQRVDGLIERAQRALGRDPARVDRAADLGIG